VANEHLVRWKCRCGADYPVRVDNLLPAYQAASIKNRKRDRVVVLPIASGIRSS
jgi:hypothetical protein